MTQMGRITADFIRVNPLDPCHLRSKNKSMQMTQMGRITADFILVNPLDLCRLRSKNVSQRIAEK